MFFCDKVFLILVTLAWDQGMAEAEAVKRDLIGHHTGPEFLQLGNFGPVSGLPTHPTFAHLGLSPQQSVGFVNILLRNGLLNPYALRLANGQPFPRDPFGHAPFFGVPGFVVDPYILFLATHHESGVDGGACGKLCCVSLIFRHGDRAPEGYYPKDPHKDASNWPNGWGQLTKLGKRQQYDLGRWFRHYYWNFLPIRYNASDIYVRSTDVDRTLMSAYCNLAGLYECWNEEESDGMAWQPIPVHTTPVREDSVLASHKTCPAYDRMLRDLPRIKEVCEKNEAYESCGVFSNLSRLTGLSINSVNDCVFLYSVLNIQKIHGFRLPGWTKDYFPQPLKEISEFAFKLPCYTTRMKRLKCGPLLKEIIQHMQDKKEGKATQKMWMYSAHDTTIVNLMQCLGVHDGCLPPYTATLLIELYRQGNEYFVTVSYKTPTAFRTLRLPCCDEFCPFHDFKRILSPVIPANWEAECCRS